MALPVIMNTDHTSASGARGPTNSAHHLPTRTAYCTISSANYLPRVMSLKASLERHHPDAILRILLVERPEVVQQLAERFGEPFLSVDQIDCPNWRQMAFYYNVIEMNTALKPHLMLALFRDPSLAAERVLYFDADVRFYSSPLEIEQQLDSASILMTPHLTRPIDGERHTMDEGSIVSGGQFNMGFLGVRRSDNTLRVLEWLKAKLELECIYDVRRHLYTDQWWAQLFLSFEDGCKVLRSEGYNMAWWNVCQRTLTYDDGTDGYSTADGPLVFFHFSNLPEDDPGRLATAQKRVRVEPGSPSYRILDDYVREVRMWRTRLGPLGPYSFEHFSSGRRIKGLDRKIYHQIHVNDGPPVDDPFEWRQFRRAVRRSYRLLPRSLMLADIAALALGPIAEPLNRLMQGSR